MSLHYILDGYNIIKQLPSQNKIKLSSSRNALIRFIDVYHPQGSRKNKVTIVFDGREDVLPYKEDTQFEIIFAKKESADDRIKKIVERSKRPKQIVVVTDDREIIFYVRHIGAKVLSVEDFLSSVKQTRIIDEKDEKKHIPAHIEMSITEELKKVWLKKH